MSYASKRSVAKAQGTDNSKNTHMNAIRHRGMQRDHIQIAPNGKVIQHYKMDSRSARFMKMFKAAQAKAAEEEANKEAEAPVDETPKEEEINIASQSPAEE